MSSCQLTASGEPARGRGALAAAIMILAFLMPGLDGRADAHETTRSFVSIERDARAISVRLRVAFRDIEVAVWMDEDLDGRITWGEVRRRLDAVDAYVRAGFALEAGGICELKRTGAAASVRSDVAYLDIRLAGHCPSTDAPLTVRSHLFHEIDPDHREFVQAIVGGATSSTLLSAASPSVELSGDTGGALGSFAAFFRAGVEHLMAGPDHLVFLLTLILPAVCAAGNARRAAVGVLTAVTGFTLAHAVTLTAATTEILRPPTDTINMLIALSIMLTAADNVWPFIPAPRAAVAAFFGIIHGFGFATALGALDLTGSGLAVALFGFNVGIEAAQVGVVLITMPALFMLAGGRPLLWIGSAGAMTVGCYWLWQRLTP